MSVGVLALQGSFHEHMAALAKLGVKGVEVRKPEQLEGLLGLIIPGGESTTMARLAEYHNFGKSQVREKVIVAVKQGNLLATAFHPELTADTRWHSLFLKMLDDNKQHVAPVEINKESFRASSQLKHLPVFGETRNLSFEP